MLVLCSSSSLQGVKFDREVPYDPSSDWDLAGDKKIAAKAANPCHGVKVRSLNPQRTARRVILVGEDRRGIGSVENDFIVEGPKVSLGRAIVVLR